jgi:hypothetical protein
MWILLISNRIPVYGNCVDVCCRKHMGVHACTLHIKRCLLLFHPAVHSIAACVLVNILVTFWFAPNLQPNNNTPDLLVWVPSMRGEQPVSYAHWSQLISTHEDLPYFIFQNTG